MLLWFAGGAVVVAWVVFRDPALDYRLLVAGALAPDALAALVGTAHLLHSVAGSGAVLVAVVVLTRGRQRRRRRLLALPVGLFLHLVLDGAWADTATFWWPVTGGSPGGRSVPSVRRGWANVPLELLGAAALAWAWHRFGLGDPSRRTLLWRRGHLAPDVVR